MPITVAVRLAYPVARCGWARGLTDNLFYFRICVWLSIIAVRLSRPHIAQVQCQQPIHSILPGYPHSMQLYHKSGPTTCLRHGLLREIVINIRMTATCTRQVTAALQYHRLAARLQCWCVGSGRCDRTSAARRDCLVTSRLCRPLLTVRDAPAAHIGNEFLKQGRRKRGQRALELPKRLVAGHQTVACVAKQSREHLPARLKFSAVEKKKKKKKSPVGPFVHGPSRHIARAWARRDTRSGLITVSGVAGRYWSVHTNLICRQGGCCEHALL